MRICITLPPAEYEDILAYARGKGYITGDPVKTMMTVCVRREMDKNPLSEQQARAVERKYGHKATNAAAPQRDALQDMEVGR